MDKKTLVNIDIEEGKKVLESLDDSNLKISSAFWFFIEDLEEWRLFFASPEFDVVGPKKLYAKVQKILQSHRNEINLPLEAISLISPKDQLIGMLRMAITTGPGISGIRFSGNVINGVLIKDAYLYRVN
ncbi:hypothetical protein [Cyclobacterium sp.]|uniref:hypothetical protein n=1 Tax=Cyclobacterium sp. TaxID=1966343 RepID=UPI0019882BA9|nr:hypothetical protein [Cyclobacterium sp.]MBD3628194.1 hypothetical protein [Cyclobacterium sp.]